MRNLLRFTGLIAIISFIAVMTGLGSFVASAENLQKLYDEGQFSRVAALGEQDGHVRALLLASQSCLVMATYEGDHSLKTHQARADLVRKARLLSLKALEGDEKNISANLNIIITTGLLNRLDKSSLKEKIKQAKQAKNKLYRLLSQDENNALTHATLAAWHAEVVGQAGGLFGKIIFGARRKKIREHYHKAMKLAPENVTIKLEYIKYSLSRYVKIKNKKKRKTALKKAKILLEEIIAMPGKTVVEQLAQGHAKQLHQVVVSARRRDIKDKVKQLTLVLH